MRIVPKIRTASRLPLLQVAKTSVATILAWVVSGLLLPVQLPIFAAIAALLVVQPSINQSFGRAVERSVGVIIGVVIALGISLLFGEQTWIVLITVVIAIFVGWLFRLTPPSANQIPISAMLVLAIGAASPEYAVERIVETLIGAAIGLIVNVIIVPPVRLGPAREAVGLLAAEVAQSLDRLAAALRSPQSRQQLDTLMIEARLLRPMREAAQAALAEGEESLTLNPRRTAHRRALSETEQLLNRLTAIVTRTVGMTRAFRDHYAEDLHHDGTVQSIATELERAAHDLRLLTRPPEQVQDADGGQSAPMPALTAPLIIRRPHPDHWILIGSLMEDLRRIREEIVGE
ncbi:aromatic acid exporter family protein [Okibacterium endophyticum]